jgi:hypothetical protein
MREANLWAESDSATLNQTQIIKDRWAACMEHMHKVKHRQRKLRHPTQMVTPNKFCSLNTRSFMNCQY